MSKFTFSVFLIILFLAQILLGTFFDFYSAVPNLFLLALVWFSVYHRGRESWILAAAGGLFLDLYAGTFFGVNLIGLLLLRMVLKIMLDSFLPREDNLVLMIGLLLSSVVAYQLFIFGLQALLAFWNWSEYLDFRRFFGIKIIWQLLYSLIIFYPLSLLARKLVPQTR